MARDLFLTGASGYLGRHLEPKLSARQSLDRPGGDLLDPRTYAAKLAQCDTVVHLAAVTGKAAADSYFRVNREGTRILVEEARRAGVRNFLHVSTIAVKFRDQRRYYYAQSKLAAEEIVRSSGLRYCIVRPTMILGRGAPVLQGLAKLAAAPVVPVFGNGRAAVQPIDVEDLAGLIVRIAGSDDFQNETIEAGGPDVLSIEDLLLRIRRILYGKPARVVHLPLGIVLPVVTALEGFLPLSAGQLASFTNDGKAEPSRWDAPRRTVDEMLRLIADR